MGGPSLLHALIPRFSPQHMPSAEECASISSNRPLLTKLQPMEAAEGTSGEGGAVRGPLRTRVSEEVASLQPSSCLCNVVSVAVCVCVCVCVCVKDDHDSQGSKARLGRAALRTSCRVAEGPPLSLAGGQGCRLLDQHRAGL